ncbi:hypothetical protein A9X00_02990 [Mycobacterium sp. 1245805.9]|nr:hypothetical protein A9X00_02990 [Mycobacterium sp. 1245805.9]
MGAGVPAGHVFCRQLRHGSEIGQHWLTTVSLVFFWDALAAWLIVVVAWSPRVSRLVGVDR